MSLKETVEQARKYPHGSLLHQRAMSALLLQYRLQNEPDANPSLEELWAWVKRTLEIISKVSEISIPKGAKV